MLCRARSGDEQARSDLVQCYREPLARFLRARLARSLRSVQETADFVQETLSAAAQQLDRFEYRGIGSFWSYLRRIGLNLIGQAGRRRGLHIAADYAWDSAHEPVARELPPSLAAQQNERLLAIEDALQRLPRAECNALLLRLELDQPYKVIAREGGYPSADAARMAVGRALARLARVLARFAP
jgi:RNA polymerase sigma factor (sigma-70 family)